MLYHAPYGSADPNAPYVDQDTPGAIVGSVPPAAAIEDPMREIVGLITAAGLTPSDSDLTQIAKAIQSGKLNYATVGGTANALTLTLPLTPDALPLGFPVVFVATASNTGNVTLNPNSLGAKSLFGPAGQQLSAGDLFNGLLVLAIFNGVSFRMIGPIAATEATPGAVELATAAETATGTDLKRPAAVGRVSSQIQSGSWLFAAAAGTANALTAALAPAVTALTPGMKIRLAVASANTGAATLNLNGLGAVSIFRLFDNSLSAGDIGIGINELVYDGTNWRLLTPANVISGSPASGWTKLNNGLIMQFGKVATNASAPVTVTFPVAFPTAVKSLVATDESSPVQSNQIAVFGVGNITTTSFQCAATSNFSTAVTDTGNWMAMGY